MALTLTIGDRTYNYSHCIGTLHTSRGGQDFLLAPGEEIMFVISRAGGADVPFGAIQRWAKWDLINDEPIFEASSLGYEDGDLLWPASVALDTQNTIYISDEYLNRISRFSATDGAFIGKWGTSGTQVGQLGGPAGMRFDSDGHLYVVEGRNHRVQKFTKEGDPIDVWGKRGSKPGQFNEPFGIHIDRTGDIFIADWGNDRVQKFDRSGRFISQFGRSGSSAGELLRPTGVSTDKYGDVYVADWGNNRIQIFDSDGEYIAGLYGDARELSKQGARVIGANSDYQKARKRADTTVEWRLFRPIAVEVDDKNRIFILESLSGRLQVYLKETDHIDPQFNL